MPRVMLRPLALPEGVMETFEMISQHTFGKVLGQFIQNSVRNESFESAEQGLMGADCALVPRKPMVNA